MSFCLENLKKRKTIPLVESEVLIGRSNNVTIQIISTLVSRIHAKLKFEENQWKVEDLKSINGIYINKNKMKSGTTEILNIGDIISLGPPDISEFKFRFSQLINLNESSDYEGPCKKRIKENFQDNLSRLSEDHNPNNIADVRSSNISDFENNNIKSEKSPESETKSENTKTNNGLNLKEVAEIETVDVISKCNTLNKLEYSSNIKSDQNDSQNLKLTIDNLKAILEEKERIQEELQKKLLLAEAQLTENNKENIVTETSKNKHNDAKCNEEENCKEHINDIMESELICSICTELFIEAITLNCSHTFCKTCIKLWKKQRKLCPVCRTSIKTETAALTINNIIEKMTENLSAEMKEKRKKLVEERLSTAGTSCSDDKKNSIIEISETENEFSDSEEDESFSDVDSYYDSEYSSSPVNTLERYYTEDQCYSCGRRGHYARNCPNKYKYSLRSNRNRYIY